MQQHQGAGGQQMMNGMYGMQNGMMAQRAAEEQPAKRFKPGQAQAVMQGNHGTSLIEAMNALEIKSHLDTLQVGPGAQSSTLNPSSRISWITRAGLIIKYTCWLNVW